MPMRKRDPRSKEELLDRMLSFDFDGDIRHLGQEAASIVRQGPNRLLLVFPASGRVFELEVHIPRGEQRVKESRTWDAGGFPEAETEATLKEQEREARQASRTSKRQRPTA